VLAITGMKFVSPFQRNVDVQMFRHTCARRCADINADVEAVRLHQMRQRIHAAAHELPQIRKLVFSQAVEIGGFFVG